MAEEKWHTWPANIRVEGTSAYSGVRPVWKKKYKSEEKEAAWLLTLNNVNGTSDTHKGTISRALAEKLTDVKEGDNVTVMKEDPGTGHKDVRWRVGINNVEVQEGASTALEEPAPEGEGNSGAPSRSGGATSAQGSTPDLSLAEMGTLMTECMTIANGVGDDLENSINMETGPEDIRSIGISLFIEANRKGIKPHSLESTAADVGPDPFNDNPPPPTEDDDEGSLPF